MTPQRHYVQYHNADRLGCYPTANLNIKTNVEMLRLDDTESYKHQFFTSKKAVEKALSEMCFLVVGKTETVKKYYLWTFFKIEHVESRSKSRYDVFGTGYDFHKPILLNELEHFNEFRKFCGNFGIGFQQIDNHIFCATLLSLTKASEAPNSQQTRVVSHSEELRQKLRQLNERMLTILPEKRLAEIEQILRKDKQMVELLKKASEYKCQFPGCNALVKTKSGTNYVEVAHIKPVNQGGQSVLGNLLVLCPNHHKEFDFGDLDIEEQTETLLKGLLNGREFQVVINW